MQPRIIFAGTPDFAARHLNELIGTDYQPVAVYTQPDRPAGRGRSLQASPVKQLAMEHDIPCYQPLNFKNPDDVEKLASLKPDLMIVVAYGLLLPQTVLDIPTLGCINVHGSILPRWRGAAPIQRAIEAGDDETGVTIMQMDAGLDTGAMLHKKTTAIGQDDTSSSLHDRLAELGADALLEALPEIINGTATPEIQDDAKATYASKMTKEEGLIDWSLSAAAIDQKIRAFTPWPGAQAELGGQRLKVVAKLYSEDDATYPAGTISSHSDKGLVVACGSGQLLIEKLQFPGKRMTDVTALLNSQQESLSVGSSFS